MSTSKSPKIKSEKLANASQPEQEAKSDEVSTAGQKSKADLRRERKAIQEEQRAKKAGDSKQVNAPSKPKQEQQSKVVIVEELAHSNVIKVESEAHVHVEAKLNLKSKTPDNLSDSVVNLANQNKSRLFHHFDQFKRDYSIIEKYGIDHSSIHPAFIKLGIECANDRVSGSNERCLGFLNAFKSFLTDYKAPANDTKTISKDLESKLKPNINFLRQCRPLAVSVGNAIKELKQIILFFPPDITEQEAKKVLLEEIESFIEEKILLAWETISKYMLADSDTIISGTSYVKSKLTNDDCILIYGGSSLVTHLLIQASKKFPKIRVVVVDSRPKLKGKQTMEQLVKHGIHCTYVLIKGISFVMNRVTKVILGAHALMANGYVMGSIGSSQIALVAKSFNVPVIVCCETYKFSEKVQTDALINNELGNPWDLLEYSNMTTSRVSPLAQWKQENKDAENINILNLIYDITSPSFINCVVSDMGILPCTSVPVVLRLKNRDNFQLGIKKQTLDTK